MRMVCWTSSELKGARYCSLGGRIAEQFPVETPDGRSLILYQTREDARFEELKTERYRSGGIEVELWRSGDLAVALASDSTWSRPNSSAFPTPTEC